MNRPPNPAGFEAVDTLVLEQLTDEERKKSVVYLDAELHAAGRSEIGGQQVAPTHSYVIGFVDQRPGANWMHPCRYLLIDPAARAVTSIVADRPPVFGVLPPTWRVVWRSLNLDDWRLLPIAAASPQKEQNDK